MKRTIPIVLSVLFAMTPGLVQGDWRFDAATGAFYDSNLSNSDRGSDEEEDWAWQSNVSVANAFQLSRDLRLNLEADLRGNLWSEYHGLNQINGGVSAGLRYRFGLGRLAPWVLLENRIGYAGFEEGDRNGWDESVALRGGIGLTDRIAIEAAYRFENFAAPNDFFDIQGHNCTVRATVDVTSALQVALGYGYREGDVISYAIPPRPDIIKIASVFMPVSTFETDPRYTAYKLLGRSHSVSISAGYAITKNLSILAAYEYRVTSHDPLDYENHLVEAKIAFAY